MHCSPTKRRSKITPCLLSLQALSSANHPPPVQPPSLTLPTPFLNGLPPPSISTYQPPSAYQPPSTYHPPSHSGSFVPPLDLAPPLTSVPASQSTPLRYSLPSLGDGLSDSGVKGRAVSEQALFNGSILEHLSPVSAAPTITSSDVQPSYGMLL